MPEQSKFCFVVGQIGEENSPERIHADWLLQEIIEPVFGQKEFEIEVIRADKISKPGLITNQILNAIDDAHLVVADLTDRNANAFYELAYAHSLKKRVIHMITRGQDIPFDLKDYRAIHWSRETPNDIRQAKKELTEAVRITISADYRPSNPITLARGERDIERSGDSKDKLLFEIISIVRQLTQENKRISADLDGLKASRGPYTGLLGVPVATANTVFSTAAAPGSPLGRYYIIDPIGPMAPTETADSDRKNDRADNPETSTNQKKDAPK